VSNIVTGRQLRAARVLAGLTQATGDWERLCRTRGQVLGRPRRRITNMHSG